MLICVIQGNQGQRDSMMHEFSSSVNKVNRAIRGQTIGDRLPLNKEMFNVCKNTLRYREERPQLSVILDERSH